MVLFPLRKEEDVKVQNGVEHSEGSCAVHHAGVVENSNRYGRERIAAMVKELPEGGGCSSTTSLLPSVLVVLVSDEASHKRNTHLPLSLAHLLPVDGVHGLVKEVPQ